MDNFQTIEVRWFYPGALPDEVRQWFNPLGESLEKIDTRSDFYLQSQALDIGVKLRQGNLEVKYRQQNLGTIAIEGVENSQVEQWSKWICIDRSSGGITPTNTAGKPGWLKVDKIRDRRLYRVDFADSVQLTQIASPTADIAAIELTQLQLQSQIWWTIACEYFGDNISIDRFGVLVRSLLDGYPTSISTIPISCGYPQWLS